MQASNKAADTHVNWLMDNGDSGPGAQWMALDLHDKMQNSCHIALSFDGDRRGSGLGAAAWILWLRDEYGIFEKVSYGGRVLMNASAMIAEREALRMGIEHLTVLFPTEVSSFDFQVENSGRTVQYKLNVHSLRLFGVHSDVNDAHRAGANRLQPTDRPTKPNQTKPNQTKPNQTKPNQTKPNQTKQTNFWLKSSGSCPVGWETCWRLSQRRQTLRKVFFYSFLSLFGRTKFTLVLKGLVSHFLYTAEYASS